MRVKAYSMPRGALRSAWKSWRVSARAKITKIIRDPENVALESLRLSRIEVDRQLVATTHERRRAQLSDAIAEVDRRMKETEAGMK